MLQGLRDKVDALQRDQLQRGQHRQPLHHDGDGGAAMSEDDGVQGADKRQGREPTTSTTTRVDEQADHLGVPSSGGDHRDNDREAHDRDRGRRMKMAQEKMKPLTDALLKENNGEATWGWVLAVSKFLHDEGVAETSEGSYQLIISLLSGEQIVYQRWAALLSSGSA